MAYTKTTWQDRVVQNPNTYTLQNNANGTTTLLPAEGTVTTTGTPINSSALNNIETQYDQAISFVKSFGIGDVAEDVTGTDLNALDATGIYKVTGSNANTLNSPDNTKGWFIFHQKYDANYKTQIATRTTDSIMYIRSKTGTPPSYQPWVKIPTLNDFSSSLGGSGWQKLPSGLILQWAAQGSVANGAQLNFPISFPTACVAVMLSPNVGNAMVGASGYTTSHFTMYSNETINNIIFFAIGY